MSDYRPQLRGLRGVRGELGLTQEAAGELVEMAGDSLRRMENGQQGFTAATIERIALRMRRPWWRFFGYRHPPEATLAPETLEAIGILEGLTEQGRRTALALVQTVAAQPGMKGEGEHER